MSDSIQKYSGRKRGARNVNKEILLTIISNELPVSAGAWEIVANRYSVLSGDTTPRTGLEMKRYFAKKMCDSMKKPTGSSYKSKGVEEAQVVYDKILAKSECGEFGIASADEKSVERDDEDYQDEEENEGRREVFCQACYTVL